MLLFNDNSIVLLTIVKTPQSTKGKISSFLGERCFIII